MRHRFLATMFALMLTCIGTCSLAAELKFPPLTARVVDDAGILNDATKADLDAMLVQHEKTSGEQVVVATLGSLQGHTIEDYGYQLGRFWGIGQKGKNNGAILIVAPNERKVRIEVGYGLEGQLTDAASRVIIENFITPKFRQGDFNAGVLTGTAAIMRVLGDETAANLQSQSAPVQPRDEIPMPVPVSGTLMLLIFFVFVMFILMRRRRYPYMMHRGRYYGPGPIDFGGRSSGGDSGGFSGGGGSFGGGGASGSW